MADKNKCHVCGRDSYFYSDYLKQGMCSRHFERMLKSRVRSSVISSGYRERTFKIRDDGSAASVLLLSVFRKDGKSKLKLDNHTLEDFTVEVLAYFIKGTKPSVKISSRGVFNPLYSTSDREVEAFASLKGWTGKRRRVSSSDGYLLDVAGDIEKRRPGGMISTVKIGRRIGII